MEYVLSLAEVAHTTAYSQHYANEIKEKSNARKLIAIADKIACDAKVGLKSSFDIIFESTLAFNDFDNPEKNSFSSVGKFISSDFLEHIKEHKNFVEKKTGFSNIDSLQIFEPGLYILGGTPACGKTTFAWQLLEQCADNGEHCIFCSYEMSKDELVAKTLARKLFLDNPNTTLTSSQILRGGWSSELCHIINKIGDFDNFIVREFTHEEIDKFLAILRPLVDSYDKPPIVCIDYLQRLIPRDGKADTRTLIDDALFKLKDFSKKTRDCW